MRDIYEQHRAAFRNVAAYVVMRDGDRVATVAFKYPADGAGRLYAYVHWIGSPMVRGWASGGGYDKATAAVEAACARSVKGPKSALYAEPRSAHEAFHMAIGHGAEGAHWDRRLQDAGFIVWQAV